MIYFAAYLLAATVFALSLCRAATLATGPRERAREDREQLEYLAARYDGLRARGVH